MFGLDDYIAGLSDGTSLALVSVVAVLLGLRHATDPDHLAAVTTLIASGRERTAARARTLGLAWGIGHSLTLFAFGLPIVLFEAYLPDHVQRSAETLVGLLIVVLAAWLLVRWRRGAFHAHAHVHGGSAPHAHPHSHRARAAHDHGHSARGRSPFQALGVGLLHGVGGSAGIGVLIVAAVESTALGVLALLLLAAFSAASMALLTTAFGLTLASTAVRRVWHNAAPALGLASFAFGCWYVLGAVELAPYYF